ncbi:MAG: rRNA maturation RNase YbeY [Prevotellaceae bacterium]|jgi:rRNA maturation RNase YbeY|nr:rRNA maturation RNase YbeY [Prevotellaceae bacterium]
MISFHSPVIRFNLPCKNAVKGWLKAVAAAEDRTVGELAFIFCSDNELLDLNRRYLQHDYYTDVITFDYSNRKTLSGDIFISIDTIRANAETYRQPFADELRRVMLHGVLHLCGYHDSSQKEKKQMREKEDFYLRGLSSGR